MLKSGTIQIPTGKWYWEHTCTKKGSNYPMLGITVDNEPTNWGGSASYATSVYYASSGQKFVFDSSATGVAYGDSYTADDVIGIAYDTDSGDIEFFKNGVSQGVAATVPLEDREFMIPGNQYGYTSNGEAAVNHGQQPFAHTPPADYLPLCTANMPTEELPDEIEGSYVANGVVDGPFIYTGCIPSKIEFYDAAMNLKHTIEYVDRFNSSFNQYPVDFLSNGFKIRSADQNVNHVGRTMNYKVYTTHTGGEYDGNKVPFNAPAPAVSN
jgi:hypothetical protein